MELTVQQRQAVEATGNILLDAGAGTGKTQTMAAKYLNFVAEGFDPLQIVAVTFTRRAAEELRQRTWTEMARVYGESDPVTLRVQAAPVSTIHSLAEQICRQFPLQSGVLPDFEVIDEASFAPLLEIDLPNLLAALPGPPSIPYPILKRLAKASIADPERFKSALLADPHRARQKIKRDAAESVDKIDWSGFEVLLSSMEGRAGDRIEASRSEVLAALGQIRTTPSTALARIAGADLRGGSPKNWLPGELNAVKDTIKELREIVRSLPKYVLLGWTEEDERNRERVEALRQIMPTVSERMRGMTVDSGRLRFDDLEERALVALDDHAVRIELEERYRAILVDEFQDVNPRQARLIEALARGKRRCVVGDYKQSIYGFRGAEPKAFLEEAERADARIPLSQSFRTVSSLTSAINRVFAPLLPEYQPIDSSIAGPDAAPIEVYLVEEDGRRIAERRESLAVLLARRIRSLVAQEYPVRDPDTGRPRPLQYRDIAILSSTWSVLNGMGEILRNEGLPAAVVGGGDLMGTQPARDGLNLLAFLADPTDDQACLGLLRSPMVRLSDQEIYTAVAGRPRGSCLFDHVLAALPGDLRLDSLNASLELANRSPAESLVRVATALGYPAMLTDLDPTGRMLADCNGFCDLVAGCDSRGQSLRGAVLEVRRLIDTGSRIERPLLGASESISLLTVHAAKGLEWPVVVVANLDRPSRSEIQPLIDAEFGIGISVDEQPSGHLELLRFLASERDEQERRRLWYVALTRARDYLIAGFASDLRVETLIEQLAKVAEVKSIGADEQAAAHGAPKSRPAPLQLARVDLSRDAVEPHPRVGSRELALAAWCPAARFGLSGSRYGARHVEKLLVRALAGDPPQARDLPWLPRASAGKTVTEIVETASQLAQLLPSTAVASSQTGFEIDLEGVKVHGSLDIAVVDGTAIKLSVSPEPLEIARAELALARVGAGLAAGGIVAGPGNSLHAFSAQELDACFLDLELTARLLRRGGLALDPKRALRCERCPNARQCRHALPSSGKST